MRPASSRPAAPAAARIGPGEALDLAVLGAAAHGPLALDRLIALVQRLGGGFWRPTADVVIRGVEAQVACAHLRFAGMDAQVTDALVAITDAGAAHVRALLRRDIGPPSDPHARAVMLIRLALLEMLRPLRRWHELDRMVGALEGEIARLRRLAAECPLERPYLRLAACRELRCTENEARWLAGLRDEIAGALIDAPGRAPGRV